MCLWVWGTCSPCSQGWASWRIGPCTSRPPDPRLGTRSHPWWGEPSAQHWTRRLPAHHKDKTLRSHLHFCYYRQCTWTTCLDISNFKFWNIGSYIFRFKTSLSMSCKLFRLCALCHQVKVDVEFFLPTLWVKSLPTSNTYSHNEWSENNPAGLPPQTGPVANHFLNVVIEFVCTWNQR